MISFFSLPATTTSLISVSNIIVYPFEPLLGYPTLVVDGTGLVLNGSCHCLVLTGQGCQLDHHLVLCCSSMLAHTIAPVPLIDIFAYIASELLPLGGL
jgi:hypothetical protein